MRIYENTMLLWLSVLIIVCISTFKIYLEILRQKNVPVLAFLTKGEIDWLTTASLFMFFIMLINGICKFDIVLLFAGFIALLLICAVKWLTDFLEKKDKQQGIHSS